MEAGREFQNVEVISTKRKGMRDVCKSVFQVNKTLRRRGY